jgi:hypothetical protein
MITSENAAKMGSKGGKTTALKNKQRKAVQTFAEAFMTADASNIVPKDVVDYCTERGIVCTLDAAMDARIAIQAVKDGDVPSYVAVKNRLCGLPTQKVDMDATITEIKVKVIKK